MNIIFNTNMRVGIGFMTVIMLIPNLVAAQLTRERVETKRYVEDIFWGTTNVGIGTVTNVSGNNLKSTVKHTFGLVSGGADVFWGLDIGANTRLGLDYGITDRLSVGIGRMTFKKVVDIRSKVNLIRQTESGSIPIDIALKVSTGISTLSGQSLEFSERLTYFTSLMAARKFQQFSLQLTPMVARFNSVSVGDHQTLFGLGILTQYEMNKRFSVSAEYLSVPGKRNTGTHDAMAISLNINTGGHIFQIYFSSSQWHGEQYIMANNSDKFWDGDFRFGFNINRVFGI